MSRTRLRDTFDSPWAQAREAVPLNRLMARMSLAERRGAPHNPCTTPSQHPVTLITAKQSPIGLHRSFMQVRKLTVIDFTYGVPILSTCSCCGRMFRVPEAEAIKNPQVARDNLIDTFNDHPCGSSSALERSNPI
jgi:hypothetical protein